MPKTTDPAGRPAQRRRTRSAILAAASALLAQGKTPSVAEVAEAAEVSRRTVYMYFPTLEQLLVDATLGTIARSTVEVELDAAERDDDVEARVERMARVLQRGAAETEQQGRTLLRLTANAHANGGSRARPPRGYRRVEWVERMLAPLRPVLDEARFERLVSALVMVLGWEALIVQRDIRGLSVEESAELSAWVARTLVRATLEEAGPAALRRAGSGGRRPRPRSGARRPGAGRS